MRRLCFPTVRGYRWLRGNLLRREKPARRGRLEVEVHYGRIRERLPSSSIVRPSNQAVPSPSNSAPKLMFFTLAPTGSSIVYLVQLVVPSSSALHVVKRQDPAGPSTATTIQRTRV